MLLVGLLNNCVLKMLLYTCNMKEKSLLSLNPAGFHKIAYTQWGLDTAKRTIICVAGLTRNSRDFDYLAQDLISNDDSVRLVCVDLPGRGASDWLLDARYYTQQQYIIDLTALIARLDVLHVTWIGTSMGGLLGMFLAAQKNSPINALILNDVGPVIPRAAIKRISKYAALHTTFSELSQAQDYLRKIYSNGGKLSEAMWQHIMQHSIVKQADGSFSLTYDPKLIHSLPRWVFFDIKLWDIWSKIHCPILVLHGENSDVLTSDTLKQMQHSKPNISIANIIDCGHAPMLMTADQIAIIRKWLKINP